MKRFLPFKKWQVWLLFVAVLLSVLSSCQAPDRPSEDTGTEGSLESTSAAGSDAEEQTILFAENGTVRYRIVRPEDASDEIIQLAAGLHTLLVNCTGDTSLGIGTDFLRRNESYDPDTYEILVGNTAYPETAAVKKEFGDTSYGCRAVGNKLVLYGLSASQLQSAVNELYKLILLSSSGSKEDGTLSVSFPSSALYVKTDTSVPSLSSGSDTLLPVVSVKGAENATQTYYEGAASADFDLYKARLEENGYLLQQENAIGENRYATYSSSQYTVHFYYIAADASIRRVVSPLETPLPTEAPTVQKLCEPMVTQLKNTNEGAGGMGYVIRLEDSTFVLFDGGYAYSGEIENLYATLARQNVRTDGKIIIRMWVITHGHNDHYNVLRKFAASYAARVTVECIAGNYPSDLLIQNSDTPSFWDYRTAVSSFPGCRYVTLHTGQRVCFAGATFRVYYTSEDLLPLTTTEKLNDMSVATMIEIGGQKVFIVGDCEVRAPEILATYYGASLKADILQVCHHGYYAGSYRFYAAVDPAVLLWPASSSFAESNKSIPVNHYLLNNLHVKEVWVSGDAQTELVLPYSP